MFFKWRLKIYNNFISMTLCTGARSHRPVLTDKTLKMWEIVEAVKTESAVDY